MRASLIVTLCALSANARILPGRSQVLVDGNAVVRKVDGVPAHLHAKQYPYGQPYIVQNPTDPSAQQSSTPATLPPPCTAVGPPPACTCTGDSAIDIPAAAAMGGINCTQPPPPPPLCTGAPEDLSNCTCIGDGSIAATATCTVPLPPPVCTGTATDTLPLGCTCTGTSTIDDAAAANMGDTPCTPPQCTGTAADTLPLGCTCTGNSAIDDAAANAQGMSSTACTPAPPPPPPPPCTGNPAVDPKGCACTGNDGDPDDCTEEDGACLAGDSIVSLRGRGPSPLASIRPGDAVLVQTIDGKPQYETILGFLHAVKRQQGQPGMATVTLVHARGELRVSPNHLVLAAAGQDWTSKMARDTLPGDWLAAGDGGSVQVIAAHAGSTTSGMFAPLTPSGSIIADGVLVSSYAQPGELLTLSHGTAHAALFPLRAFHKLGLGTFGEMNTKRAHNEVHPFAEALLGALRAVTGALRN